MEKYSFQAASAEPRTIRICRPQRYLVARPEEAALSRILQSHWRGCARSWQTERMHDVAGAIGQCLQAVEAERTRRGADPGLAAGVAEIKRYQHARFAQTYADLLAHASTHDAACFFQDELYGPKDFSQRDAQFARVVPGLIRLFPPELSAVVLELGQLHALSEQLDSAMGAAVAVARLSEQGYARAWQQVGQAAERERQIQMVLDIGLALARQVRRPFLRRTLRLMRGPAAAAGLSRLHAFLESGFDAFARLSDAPAFLQTIASRERAMARRLFSLAL